MNKLFNVYFGGDDDDGPPKKVNISCFGGDDDDGPPSPPGDNQPPGTGP